MLRRTRFDLALLSAILFGTSACTEQAASEAEREPTLLVSDVRMEGDTIAAVGALEPLPGETVHDGNRGTGARPGMVITRPTQ